MQEVICLKKMLLVINPYAGTRKINKSLVDVLTVFNRGGYDVQTYITAGQNDAREAVRQRCGEMDLVVCAGGDGTFNETLAGIMESGCPVPMGYIPCGSTNDFAASLKLSTNVLDAAKEIVEGVVQQYDVGRFGKRYFSYVASFGVFTKTSYSTPQNVKNALGHTAYILEGIQELSQFKTEHVCFELEDQVIEDDFLFGAVSNSLSVGGILTLDPKQVDMKDGKFELLLVRAPKNLREVQEFLQALQKQQYNCAMMTFVSTKRMKVIASPEMNWTLDGERQDGCAEIEIENIPLAFQLMKRG